jgi:hypothetical protein
MRDAIVGERHANEIANANDRVVVRPVDGPHLILQTAPKLAWQAISAGTR